MSDLTVKLDAYVLPDDHAVYKYFPGQSYRFYKVVRDAEAVFLDIRGLDSLVGDPSQWPDDDVLKLIADDRWTREVHRTRHGGEPKGGPEVSSVDRRHLRFLKGLLIEAKKGDLIVVAAEGYDKDVLIGEILDEPGQRNLFIAKDDEEVFSYPGRRVHWRARKPKRELSPALIDILHHRTAFYLIERSARDEIYQLAYDNFVFRGAFLATFETSKQHFTSDDSFITSLWFKSLTALRIAIENGDTAALADKDIVQIAMMPVGDASQDELSININSPGAFVLRSAGVFGFAVMAMLPLSEAPAEAVVGKDVHIELNTVGSAGSECSVQIEQTVREYINTLGYDRWQKECEIAKRAREDATLHTKARLITHHGRPN